MAALAVPALIAGTAVSAIGSIASGNAAKRQADMEAQRIQAEAYARRQALEFEAAQLDNQAKTEFALGQRDMLEKRRGKEMALSTLQARSAASGFSATDPTALALGDEISRYGTLQEQMSLFGGESQAEGLKLSAAGRRFTGESGVQAAAATADAVRASGRSARTAGYFNAAGTVLGSIASYGMAGKYGSSGGFTPYRNSGGALVINRYGS